MKGKIFNLPNILSISRVCLLPFIFDLMRKGKFSLLLFILIVVSFLTDLFDGFCARKMKLNSNFGRIIDPLADKITIFVLGILAIVYSDFPIEVLFLIIFREFLVVLGSIFLFEAEKVIFASNIFGKIMYFFLNASVLAYIFDDIIKQPIPFILLSTGVFFLFISLISYFLRFFSILKARQL